MLMVSDPGEVLAEGGGPIDLYKTPMGILQHKCVLYSITRAALPADMVG
jgi:hypothetical protein